MNEEAASLRGPRAIEQQRPREAPQEQQRERETPQARPPAPPRALSWDRLRPLLGDRRRAVVVLVAGSVLTGLSESGILAILAQAAVALVNRSSHVQVNAGPASATLSVGAMLAVAFALGLLRLALQGVVATIPARIASELQAKLRSETFAAFTRASWGEQSRDREGHLQELATNQIAQSTAGAMQATQLVIALMSFAVLVVSALALNVAAALAVLLAAGALFFVLRPLSSVGSRHAHVASRASLNYAGGVNESVRMAEETQVFGVAEAQRGLVDELVQTVKAPFFQMQLLARLVPGIYQSLIYLLVAAALAGLYATGTGHVASLGAVVLLLVRAGTYGQQIQGSYTGIRQALPYLQRVQDAQQRYELSTAPAGARRLTSLDSLALEDVSFAYEPHRPILSGISFEVAARETIGIVGPTGAGKSTLVQILLGLRPPSSGRYLVDGLPAAEYAREDWHRAVSYLPQEPRLLHATVAENIRFFRGLDDDAVEQAARLAGVHEEIVRWPQGYDTVVGPRADAVSGGQQQRICLARALAARPEVLILDEPTSALDPHTEMVIQESLTALKHELTLFVVAHRMTTLDICERVMVIVDGRLQAFDTASALLSDSPYYRSAIALSVGGGSASGPRPG